MTTLLPAGEVRGLYGDGLTVYKRDPKTGYYHRGLACLVRVGMKTKGWLGTGGGLVSSSTASWNMAEALR